MKFYKRLLATSAALCMALFLAACGSNNDTPSVPSSDEPTNTDPIQIATKPMTEAVHFSVKCSSRSLRTEPTIPGVDHP